MLCNTQKTALYNPMQRSLQHTATHCNSLRTHCNTLQHTATNCNSLQHTATHCNSLQHTAAHCNTLQLTAAHCNNITTHTHAVKHAKDSILHPRTALTATHCNSLQHSATLLHSLQHTAPTHARTDAVERAEDSAL